MDGSNHVAEVAHADVEACSVSEHAVVELSFVRLGVRRGVADGLSVLILSVASPHTIDGFLAGQKVVGTFLEHFSVANVNTDGVILAITVAVTKKTDLGSVGSNLLNFNTELMLAASLLLPSDGVGPSLIEEVCTSCGVSSRTKVAHYLS